MLLFSQSQHQARLHPHPVTIWSGICSGCDPRQQVETTPVARSGPSFDVERWNRLDVVIENIRARLDNPVDIDLSTAEVRCQHLDLDPSNEATNLLDASNEVTTALIR